MTTTERPADAGDWVSHRKQELELFASATKAVGLLLLLVFAATAVAFPEGLNQWLKRRGLSLESWTLGPVKVTAIAKNTVRANNSALVVMDTLNEVQARLASGETSPASLQQIADLLQASRQSVTSQAETLRRTAQDLGATSKIPSEGWLYVGYYGEDGVLRRPYSRIASADGIHTERAPGNQIRVSGIVLKFDAPVVTDGNDCTKPDVSQVKVPDPNAEDISYAIVGASAQELKVLATATCPAAGRGYELYARIVVPKDRVRIATLSNL
jgi:hypothetical protein